MLHMDDVVLAQQRVLIREDLNVPMKNALLWMIRVYSARCLL